MNFDPTHVTYTEKTIAICPTEIGTHTHTEKGQYYTLDLNVVARRRERLGA